MLMLATDGADKWKTSCSCFFKLRLVYFHRWCFSDQSRVFIKHHLLFLTLLLPNSWFPQDGRFILAPLSSGWSWLHGFFYHQRIAKKFSFASHKLFINVPSLYHLRQHNLDALGRISSNQDMKILSFI